MAGLDNCVLSSPKPCPKPQTHTLNPEPYISSGRVYLETPFSCSMETMDMIVSMSFI